jgi:hypothetical protein
MRLCGLHYLVHPTLLLVIAITLALGKVFAGFCCCINDVKWRSVVRGQSSRKCT